MKNFVGFGFTISLVQILVVPLWAAVDATQLVKKVEEQSIGKSLEAKLKITLNQSGGTREIEVLSWTEGKEKAMIKILKPLKDQNTANLRIKFDLWQYLPKIERTIKIPPSLMLQSWMGSDFTNDDLVKTSSMSRDYTHKFTAEETIDGTKTQHLTLSPKKDAPVVWGRIEVWINAANNTIVQQEFYSEKGELLKRLKASQVKTFGTHTISSIVEMTTIKKGTSTKLEYVDAKFDQNIKASVFSQSFLKDPLP